MKSENSNSQLNRVLYENNNAIYNLRTELTETQAELLDCQNKVSGIYPLIITDIKIGNLYKDGTIETKHGDPIYSKNTMCLGPNIEYI